MFSLKIYGRKENLFKPFLDLQIHTDETFYFSPKTSLSFIRLFASTKGGGEGFHQRWLPLVEGFHFLFYFVFLSILFFIEFL